MSAPGSNSCGQMPQDNSAMAAHSLSTPVWILPLTSLQKQVQTEHGVDPLSKSNRQKEEFHAGCRALVLQLFYSRLPAVCFDSQGLLAYFSLAQDLCLALLLPGFGCSHALNEGQLVPVLLYRNHQWTTSTCLQCFIICRKPLHCNASSSVRSHCTAQGFHCYL